MSSIPSLRLIYFPVRARAEAARMIVAYGDIACKEEDCTSFQYRPGSSSSEDSDTPDRSRGLEAFLQEQRGLTRRLQLDREALLAQNET